MPYEPLHDAVADDVGVDDDAVVCRYMDLAGLAVLLTTGRLKLTPISELRDRTEGRWWRPARHPSSRAAGEMLRANTAVSCWSATEAEHIAMWSAFAPGLYGVLLRTTLGDLKNSFERTEFAVYLSRVEYHDAPPSDRVPVSQALALKSSAFAHENEIRVISKEGWHKLIAAATRQTISEFPLQPFTNMATTELRMIDIDTRTLINEIRTSPYADDSLAMAVEGLLSRVGLDDVRVETSEYRDLFR